VVAAYSSRGPTWYDGFVKPDLVAPGHNLVSDAAIGSTLFAGHPDRQVALKNGPARFFRMSGTSMAAAVTSGVAALVIEASRAAFGGTPSPEVIKAILEYSALPLTGADALTQGHGGLNASGAVAIAAAVNPSLPPARWIEGALPSPVTSIDGQLWSWGQTLVWSDTIVWGNTGDTIVWGNTMVWGSTIVWGNDIGGMILWGTSIWDTP
jgi:serine protease AprX